MRLIYVTLNSAGEARRIARRLLEGRLAVCCNWFPITCAYRWEGEIKEEAEVVLLVKTQAGYSTGIEAVVASEIAYTNCIFELTPDAVNAPFLSWLETEVPSKPRQGPSR